MRGLSLCRRRRSRRRSRPVSPHIVHVLSLYSSVVLALYQSLKTHHTALKSLQREHKKQLEREKALGDILDQLRTGYNPNYQDMAVLEAVRGWEQLSGLPHINDVGKEDENDDELGSDDVEDAAADDEEELEEGMWTAMQLEHQLDDLLRTDYDGLLIEHDKHVGAPASPTAIRKYYSG